MSFLSDIGGSIIQSATGQSADQLQAQLNTAEQQLQVGLSVFVGLQAVIAVELFLLVVLAFKQRG